MKKKKTAPEAVKEKYQLTEREQVALGKHFARRAAESPAPRIKVLHSEKAAKISLDHPENAIGSALLMEALGTTDTDFVNGLIGQLADAGSPSGPIAEDKLNFLLSIVKDIKPKDQLEAMLAAQMAVTHMATLRFARQLGRVETIQQQDSAERTLNKLARTFAMQLEALKRYRTCGEQKVTVQHVSVNEGGQAIVGNVTQNAGMTAPEQPSQLTPALTDARQPAMEILDESTPAPVAVPRGRRDDEQSSS